MRYVMSIFTAALCRHLASNIEPVTCATCIGVYLCASRRIGTNVESYKQEMASRKLEKLDRSRTVSYHPILFVC